MIGALVGLAYAGALSIFRPFEWGSLLVFIGFCLIAPLANLAFGQNQLVESKTQDKKPL